jgi:two-component system chemotaxis response regulator CheY
VLTTGNRLLPFWIIDLGSGSGYLRAISPHQRKPLARKILLADDSVTAQNMGRKILADAGYEVITVNNGSAALKKIAEQKPDLIVLDVYMPGYSGLEVCQRLKEAQETSRVPVLLTVGKLEPFKPEEARRVRADGFIVKPFEASELLSALSKLEDKIVHRGESSKPGRFARATAALDEGRYDKSVASDEDSGWKNRISFPAKKKEKAQEEESEDTAIYNAMNKDLRTVVDRKVAEPARDARVEEPRVDLGALAPEGLPKDVTAEEIAALAAAAAQVKGKLADSPVEPALTVAAAETAKPEEIKTEQKGGASEPIRPSSEPAAEPMAAASAAATFAEQKCEEKAKEEIATPAAAISDQKDVAPSRVDVMAAIAALEPDAATSLANSGNGSGNGSWDGTDRRRADEPVTMAVAAGQDSVAARASWAAVSVAVAPEEAAISLELEMQKAYAAFAAAESGHAGLAAGSAETQSASTSTQPATAMAAEISSQAEVAAPEPVVAVPVTRAPEEARGLAGLANAATEAISAAVKELESVAASFLEPKSPAPEPVPAEQVEAASQPAPESSETSNARVESAGAEPAPEAPKLETNVETAKQETAEIRNESPVGAIPADEATVPSTGPAESSIPAFVNAFAVGQASSTSKTSTNEVPASPASASQDLTAVSVTPGEPATRGNGTPVNGGPASGDPANKESEIAANTAAAWASWRRIRESGAPLAAGEPFQKEVEESASDPKEEAAMAVAAGAEKAPEEVPATSEAEEGIASIVDSVLAEMRPKIYEEISRKMKKK